jgi:hypothetical protein
MLENSSLPKVILWGNNQNQEKYLMGLVTFDKKALIIVNADVT